MSNTITVFRVPPLNEFKAAREMRQAGFRAYLPCEKINGRRHPIARGYISGTGKPYEAKHVRQAIGDVPRAQWIKLYPSRDRGHQPAAPQFSTGDKVELKGWMRGAAGEYETVVGVLIRKRGRRQWMVSIDGQQICAQTTSLIRIDPG